jgi:HTH-type transcriptional regulator/antitoxin HigA
VEAIKFRMEQAGLAPKDLVPAIGRLNRVYEILNHKRPLTLNMIRRLHEKFGIPAESLILPSKLSAAA